MALSPTAAAKHHNRFPNHRFQAVEHRPAAGLDAAAQRAEQVEIDLRVDHHGVAGAGDHILAEGRLAKEQGQILIAQPIGGGAILASAAKIKRIKIFAS